MMVSKLLINTMKIVALSPSTLVQMYRHLRLSIFHTLLPKHIQKCVLFDPSFTGHADRDK